MIRTILKWATAPTLIAAAAYVSSARTESTAKPGAPAPKATIQKKEGVSTALLAQQALALRVAALESKLAGEDRDSATPTAPAARPAEDPRPSEPLSEEEKRAHSERERAEYDAILDASFATQGADPAWAIPAERSARELLGPLLGKGSSLRTLSCRESLCRIEILHSSREGHDTLLQGLTSGFEWSGPGSFSLQEPKAEGLTTLGFLGRDGVPFPTDSWTGSSVL